MTVIASGPITVGPGDFALTHRGKQIAIKVRSDFGVIVGCVFGEKGWAVNRELMAFDIDNTGSAVVETAKAGGAVQWVDGVLVPLVNEWFADLFAAGAVDPVLKTPTIPAGDVYQQLDAAIIGLKGRVRILTDGRVTIAADVPSKPASPA